MNKFQPKFKKSIDRSNPAELQLAAAMTAMCKANSGGEYSEAEQRRAEVVRLLTALGVPCRAL